MNGKALLGALLGCLVATGAAAQQSNVAKEIIGYRDLSVAFSKSAADCNLQKADLYKAHLSDKLAEIGITQTTESYAGVSLLVSGQKFGVECVTLVEMVFEAAVGKDNFVTSDERLKAAIDRMEVVPIIFYQDGRMAVQPQAQPSAGGETTTSQKAALAMIDELVASLKAKRQ